MLTRLRAIVAGCVLAALISSVPMLEAQQAPDPNVPLSFEAASIKANKSGDVGGFVRRQPGGRFTATNMPLRQLILFAYQVQPAQLIGGPNWLASERFDIVAKLEGDPPPVMPGSGPDHMMLAMRTLLAERVKLAVHRETRDMDVYALMMAKPGGKPGPNLKASTQDCSPQAIQGRRGGAPPAAPGADAPFCGLRGTPGRLQLGGFPLSQFANALQGAAGRMVIDRTDLSGNWDAELTFLPDRQGPPGALPPGVEPPDPNAPNLFTALQEQLGLKLESTKAPVDVLIIDHVEQPTAD
jgi:bla regulator protein blaR1